DARRRRRALVAAETLGERERTDEHRVAVGAPAPADTLVEVRQRTGVPRLDEQFGGADRSGTEDEAVARDRGGAQHRTCRVDGLYVEPVAAVAVLTDREHPVTVAHQGAPGGLGRRDVVLREIELRDRKST